MKDPLLSGEMACIIARNLRYARSRTKMTQLEVAEKAGISRMTLSAAENGRRPLELVNLIKIADVLDVTLDDLTKGVREKIKESRETDM